MICAIDTSQAALFQYHSPAAEQAQRPLVAAKASRPESPDKDLLRERFAKLHSLGDGWDGPGSLKPSRKVSYFAASLLDAALSGIVNPAAPFIVPMSDGGLQIEWHRNGADLEIALFANGQVSGLFEDRIGGREVEAEGDEALNLLLRHARRVASQVVDAPDASGATAHVQLQFAA